MMSDSSISQVVAVKKMNMLGDPSRVLEVSAADPSQARKGFSIKVFRFS